MRITTQNSIPTKPQLADILANLKVGDSVRGKIVEMLGESISIRTASGQMLTAALMTEADIKLGDVIELNIKNITPDTITAELKSKEQRTAGTTEDGKLQQLLKQLNIKPEENNLNAAKLLMKFNMPLTKENIVGLVNTQKSVEAMAQGDLPKAAALMQSGLNVNQTEISKLVKHALVAEEQGKQAVQILAQENSELLPEAVKKAELLQNSVKAMNPITAENNPKTALQLMTEAVNINENSQSAPKVEKLIDTILKVFETASQVKPEHTAYMKSKDIEITPAAMKALVDNATGTNKLSKQLDGLEKLVEVLEQNQVDAKELKSEIKRLFLKPEALQEKEQLAENFKDIVKVSSKLEVLVKEHGLENKLEASVLQEVKNNLDFVRNINQNMNYLQIPLQVNEQKTAADIYVFNNKKSRKNVNPENATILIALDLSKLGHLESLISVQKKNVNITFKVEKEEFKRVISANTDALKQALEARGYNLNPLSIIDIKDKFNLLELEELARIEPGQLHLDIRV